MRSKTTHAVWSGVGKSAARESESAKCRYSGKSAWRTPTPHFDPENFGSLGLFVGCVSPPVTPQPFLLGGNYAFVLGHSPCSQWFAFCRCFLKIASVFEISPLKITSKSFLMNAQLSVLVVVEADLVREGLVVRLQTLGFTVISAASLVELKELNDNLTPDILLVRPALDHQVTREDLQFINLKRTNRRLPILGLLPAMADSDRAGAIAKFGLDDMLPDDAAPDQLDAKLRAMIRLNPTTSGNSQLASVKKLAEYCPDGLIGADAHGKIIFFNPALQALFAPEKILNGNIFDLFDEVTREHVRRAVTSNRPRFAPPVRATLHQSQPPHHEAEITSEVLADQSLILSIRPIVHCHEVDHQAILSQRLDVLGQLTGGITHDLNNVLNAVIGGLTLLELDADEALQSQIRSILTTARRGGNLLQQLLLFSRGSDDILESTDLNEIVRECAAIAADTFPRNIEVRVHRAQSQDLPAIEANAAQLHQIFMNLCVNARDGMPGGGSLTLTTDRCLLSTEEVSRLPHAKVAGAYLTVKITDSGQGIPQAVRDRIFEPFFTTKPKGKGTGLGLPTVMRLMQLHGGFVEVDSTEGGGTRMTCYFPFAC
jgi:signal transduction histidine kinase